MWRRTRPDPAVEAVWAGFLRFAKALDEGSRALLATVPSARRPGAHDGGTRSGPGRVAPGWIGGGAITFSPFAGVGAGGRSYNHRSLDVDATHNVAAYGSAGAELGIRRVRQRLEVRDYVTGFRPLDGVGAARTGNDVVVMAGLRFVRR